MDLDIEEFVAQRFDNLCEQRDISRYEIAKRTGISQTALSNILHMKQTPTLYTLDKICKAFNISIAEFFSTPESIAGLSDEQKEFLSYLEDMSRDEKRFLKVCLKNLREMKE